MAGKSVEADILTLAKFLILSEEVRAIDERPFAFQSERRAAKAARHNRFDPDLVRRSREGDIDAAQEMLIRSGIIDSMKEK